ncbi:MAG: hypothetical protein Ta2D_03030 [Rickettsiales bacterium]|nr:MAG: hypothetical protein Ta2D_03030 [Rickettsiales bacterium]
MVKNDYLNFRSLKELQDYANQEGIFDSTLISMFHEDYVRNLQKDDFNEQYYLNKKYGDKTPMELAIQRATYFAGINQLYKEGKILKEQKNELREILSDITSRENEEIERFMNVYHKNLFSEKNPLFTDNPLLLRKKISNITLNQSILSDAIKLELESLELNIAPVINDDIQMGNFSFRTINFTKQILDKKITPKEMSTLPTFIQKEEQRKIEKDIADELKPEKKEYVEWLTGPVKEIADKILNVDIDQEKDEGIINEYIKSLDFCTNYEINQIKILENEKNHTLRILNEKIKEAKWLSSDKKKLKNKLERKKVFYTQKEAELQENIREERVEYYNKFNSILSTPNKREEYLSAQITQGITKKDSPQIIIEEPQIIAEEEPQLQTKSPKPQISNPFSRPAPLTNPFAPTSSIKKPEPIANPFTTTPNSHPFTPTPYLEQPPKKSQEQKLMEKRQNKEEEKILTLNKDD